MRYLQLRVLDPAISVRWNHCCCYSYPWILYPLGPKITGSCDRRILRTGSWNRWILEPMDHKITKSIELLVFIRFYVSIRNPENTKFWKLFDPDPEN